MGPEWGRNKVYM